MKQVLPMNLFPQNNIQEWVIQANYLLAKHIIHDEIPMQYLLSEEIIDQKV